MYTRGLVEKKKSHNLFKIKNRLINVILVFIFRNLFYLNLKVLINLKININC